MKIFFLLLICLAFYNCAPKSVGIPAVTGANPLSEGTEIFFLQPNESLPARSEFVREIKLGESLFANNCGFKNRMDYAELTAKQSGANLIHLTEIRRPGLGNGCYQISARLYKNLDDATLTELKNSRAQANKSRLSEDANFAIVYFYRPRNHEGALIGYNIKMDNKGVIGRSANGAIFEYRVIDFGKHKFSGKTRKQDAVVLDIAKGQEYFIRCGVAKGPVIVKPDMYVMENYVALQEIAEMQ